MKVNIEGIELNLNDTYYNNFCERLYPVDLRECSMYIESVYDIPFLQAVEKYGKTEIQEQLNEMLRLESEMWHRADD